MPDLGEFEALYAHETEEAIAARWAQWANEGLAPGSPEWTDTEPPGMWWMCTRPGVREAARMYDLFGTETVAAAFPQWAWGSYLDDHALRDDLDRNAATQAEGEVTFTGTAATPIPAGQVVYVPTASDETEAREFEVIEAGVIGAGAPGTVILRVRARQAGADFNVGAGAITALSPPIQGVTVTNVESMRGGSDTEGDESLGARVVASHRRAGGANNRFYERIALDTPGVSYVWVQPLWDGPGTVRLVILDSAKQQTSQSVIDELQAVVDPVLAQGKGAAPSGVGVTVVTPTGLGTVVTATIEFEAGYSLDGTGGATALEDVIEAAIIGYVESVGPGEEVVLRSVIRTIMSVRGVHDCGSVSLSGAGGNGNVAIPWEPPRVAKVTSFALTEGAI